MSDRIKQCVLIGLEGFRIGDGIKLVVRFGEGLGWVMELISLWLGLEGV